MIPALAALALAASPKARAPEAKQPPRCAVKVAVGRTVPLPTESPVARVAVSSQPFEILPTATGTIVRGFEPGRGTVIFWMANGKRGECDITVVPLTP